MPYTQPFRHPIHPVPLKRCYWVIDNLLLAGAYPGHSELIAHKDRITGLWQAGMRTFVNLMEEKEVNNDGEPFVRYDDSLRELAARDGQRVACLRFPIPDRKITTHDRMRSILDAIDLSLSQNIPVYVHCFGGIGRTGTVVSCWLLRHGLATKDSVPALLTKLRQADTDRSWREAPENDLQRNFVKNWPEPTN